MRNVASLLEPILLHLAADKTKERHDALTRLKTILDGDPSTFKIETPQAVKLVLLFVKMLRLDLKTHLIPKNEASYEEVEAARNMTSIQSNKTNQLMKDLKWMICLMDSWFPSTLLLMALPDLYNFFLDVLESCLTSAYGDVLSIMRSLVFCHKAYLFEMRQDQMSRLMNVIRGFVFPEDGYWLTVSLESDVIGCLFYAILAIPNGSCTWSKNALECTELLIGLLHLTRQRNHESMAICILFRSVNYLMNEVKKRDSVNYEKLVSRINPIMLSYSTFKTVSVLEQYYLYFLSNFCHENRPSPVLATVAAAEAAKSRMKPADLDYIKLEECIWAYNNRDQSFCFPKGYISFVVGLDFTSRFINDHECPIETALKMGPGSAEVLSLALYKKLYGLNSILKLFERSTGASQTVITAMILAKLRGLTRHRDSKDFQENCEMVFETCVTLILKHCALQNACRILAVIIGINPDLVYRGPKFERLGECLNSCILSEPCLSFLFVYYGVYFRGLWWSGNAVEGYKLICNNLMQAMESSNDPRPLLDVLISHSHLLAKLLMIPFSKGFNPGCNVSCSWKYPENECLAFFYCYPIECSAPNDFEVQLEPSQFSVFAKCFHGFKMFLNEFVQTIGFQSIKILMQNHFQANVKEENFWSGVTQMFNLYCHVYSSGSFGQLTSSVPAIIPLKDISRLAEVVYVIDLETLLNVLKLLIQSFEFYKFKTSSNQDSSSFAGNNLGVHRACSYLNHFDEKSHSYSYLFMELLFLVKDRLSKSEMTALDRDSLLFLGDFDLYSKDQYYKLLSESAVFLDLFPYLAFGAFNEKLVEVFKNPLYRHDDVAIKALALFLNNCLSEDLNLQPIKPFTEALIKRYLKWTLSWDAKLAVLELVLEMCKLKMLDSDTILKILLEPDVKFMETNRGQYIRLLRFFPTDELVETYKNDGIIWQTSSCISETLTKMEVLRVLILSGMIDTQSALRGICFGMTKTQLEEASREISYFTPSPSYGIDILCEWIRCGHNLLTFPAHIFFRSDGSLKGESAEPIMTYNPAYQFSCSTNVAAMFLSHPKVFSQIVMTLGVAESTKILNPTPEFLKKCFPQLVAVALVLYFSGQHETTDIILSQLLKKSLPDGEFESCFRENVLEIIFSVIELSLRIAKPKIIDQSVSHIATMFKYESCMDLYAPAYTAHLLLMASRDSLPSSEESVEIIELLESRCPTLLSEPLIIELIRNRVEDAIFFNGGRDIVCYLGPPVIRVVKLMMKGGDASLLIAVILGHVHSDKDTFELWKRELMPLVSGDLKHFLDILCGATITDVFFGEQMDQLVDTFCKESQPDQRLITRFFNSKCIGPKSATRLMSLPECKKVKAEIYTFLCTKKAEYIQPEIKISKQQPDLLHELLHALISTVDSNGLSEPRQFLSAITQLLSSEAICSEGSWNNLDAILKEKVGFLRLSTGKRRLLLPKPKPACSLTTIPFELIWSQGRDGFCWETDILHYWSQNFSKNPIWSKIAYVYSDGMATRPILPALVEDCFFSNPSKQNELLEPLKLCLQTSGICCSKFEMMVEVMERILCRLKSRMLMEFDFKRLGNILALREFQYHQEDKPFQFGQRIDHHIRALFFFEYGLSSFESISCEDADVLEQLYEAIDAKDYAGCFSDSTRLARINTQLDQLLKGSASFNAETSQAHAPLWQLQQWDIEAVPESFSINQCLVDEFNIFKGIAQDKPDSLRVVLDQIVSRSPHLEDRMLKIVSAGLNFMKLNQIEVDHQSPDPVDLCLLSMRANCQSKLAETAAQVLWRYRSENDLLKIKLTLSLLESSADSMGLRFVMSSEKSRMLWEKGCKDQAIQLIKMTLINAPSGPIDDVFLREYVASTYCLVADWLLQNRSEKPSSIKENYLDTALSIIGRAPSNSDTLAYVYSTYAKFVDHLFDQMSRAENLEFREQLLKQSKQDLDALTKLAQNGGKAEAVLRSLKESEKQYMADMADFEEIEKSRTSFLLLAVENYLRCLQLVDKHDFSVFRVCSLWLQHYIKVPQLSQLIAASLGRVPCHKFLPLIYQLAARAELSEIRSSETGDFQDTLERLLYRMAVKHPYHCVYQILALRSGAEPAKGSKRKLVYSTETLEVRRAAAAAALTSKLKSCDSRVAKIVESIEMLCNAYTELADIDLPADTKTNVNIPFDSRWPIGKISRLPLATLLPLAIPTKAIPVDPSGQYVSLTTVTGFGDGFRVVGGINLPKIIDCVGSDGQVYRQLVKGKDDVRQDAVMEQVFCLVDQMLKSNEATRKKGLGIRTYRIIPLHALAGLLEWVSDTVPLGEYVLPAHEKYHPDDLGVKAARNHMKAVWEDASSSTSRKHKTYLGICSRFRPVLRHFFWETSRSPSDWWERRGRYVSSCAATSMLGHVVGLGDRHCQNILLDKKTGELIQIDLNMIFELGKTLRVPERVPFRLTRDIVDGMGPAGTEGGFTKASEETMRLLRKEAETILMILEVFKFDPLYRWSLNPIKQARNHFGADKEGSGKFKFSLTEQEASAREKEASSTVPPEADRALLRVREKLLGFEEGGCVQLSESGQIKFLIQAATSPEALSQMYIGWQPWV